MMTHPDNTIRKWPGLLASRCLFLLLALCCAGIAHGEDFSPSEQTVLRAYLAYYGRPPDPDGLSYWAARVENSGSLDAVMEAFGSSQEFRERFGALSNEELVNNLYRQTFGRDAEPEGLRYWVAELESGSRTLSGVALQILYGAQNDDAVVVVNRALVAESFVRELSDPAAQRAYRGSSAASALATLMASVTANPLTAMNAMNRFYGRVAGFLAETSGSESAAEDAGDGVKGMQDLWVPDGFSFSSSRKLAVDIDARAYLDEPAYLLVCSAFDDLYGEYEIDYGSCQLRAPLEQGVYRGELTLTDTVNSLLVAVIPLAEPEAAVYFEWLSESGGEALTVR